MHACFLLVAGTSIVPEETISAVLDHALSTVGTIRRHLDASQFHRGAMVPMPLDL